MTVENAEHQDGVNRPIELYVDDNSEQIILEEYLEEGHAFDENILNEELRYFMHALSFPINLWSCYDRTLDMEDRTNNFAEAAHRRLHTLLDLDPPSISRFLTTLMEVQKLYDFQYEKNVGGIPPVGKRTVYSRADARILSLVLSFGQQSLEEYVGGLAHNFIMDQ